MGIFGKDKPQEQLQTNSNPPQARSTMSSASLLQKEATVSKSDDGSDWYRVPSSVNDVDFSDLYITPDKKCYVWSKKSSSGLVAINFTDGADFLKAVIEKYDGNVSSYSLNYKGRCYRIERTVALDGEQYCLRKLPAEIPDIEKLGLPRGVYIQLMQLANKSGLILLTGATGSGKSTTISALIKKYLQTEGGYAFTIEDPIEMPLDGVYKTNRGDLGLCKQTMPPEGKWEQGIKSALRSKPRYIYLGEIRSPDSAMELLRASTSGHLVLSTIHGNNVSDAINALGKYAASSGISEDLANELMANGLLACIHQKLVGTSHQLVVEAVFANPNRNMGCQTRSMIRTGKLNLATIIEQQKSRMELGKSLFDVQARPVNQIVTPKIPQENKLTPNS